MLERKQRTHGFLTYLHMTRFYLRLWNDSGIIQFHITHSKQNFSCLWFIKMTTTVFICTFTVFVCTFTVFVRNCWRYIEPVLLNFWIIKFYFPSFLATSAHMFHIKKVKILNELQWKSIFRSEIMLTQQMPDCANIYKKKLAVCIRKIFFFLKCDGARLRGIKYVEVITPKQRSFIQSVTIYNNTLYG